MTDRKATTTRLTQAGLNLIGQALSIYDADLRLAVCNRMFATMFDLPEELTRPGADFADTIRFLLERGEYGPTPDLEAMLAERIAQARAGIAFDALMRRADAALYVAKNGGRDRVAVAEPD